ncbi:fibronectin type III-like domain-contianing protein [Nocardia salmonicida]|uniref:fibronectin type III-like domain-contianing protein n=1 Tax=Nocardia salmonicida TaxID=53431 RepID=UPI003868EB0A
MASVRFHRSRVLRIEPGEIPTLEITLTKRAFEHWTDNCWAIEPGRFTVQVGTSVNDLQHTATIG